MIVLDTCAIIWNALKPELLSVRARRAISAAKQGDGMCFCGISLWEIAMLIKKRRLDPGTDYQSFIRLIFHAEGYRLIDLDAEIAEIAANLPVEVSKDPADRIIAATALVTSASLVTADKNLRRSKWIKTIW